MKNKAQPDAIAHANAERIRTEIDNFKSRLSVWSPNRKEFWGHVKDLNELFKNLRPLAPQDRQTL